MADLRLLVLRLPVFDLLPELPGYSAEILPETRLAYAFPDGPVWARTPP